ncbi:MAG TPA: rod shape-determining protein RodA [Candidatus Faeciplasma avium]|uniref:Rod shape-determining protein RodA n=1 Tax=Candidatus Faeciplasma avium TaxID=2840798 RepID=A0A9D1NP08_9FIRM|nr:rod shape-determining protein RodA [Candidatus Faeciplasma avium]
MTGVRTLLGAVVKRALAYIKRLDKLLLLLAGCCSAIGITLIYSLVINSRSQRITDAAVDSQTVKVQLIAALVGLFLALIIAVFDYRWFSRLWFLYLPAALGLTLLTFTGLGISGLEGADDRAWIDLGFITVQPAEFLKLAYILSLSYHCFRTKEFFNNPLNILALLVHGGLPAALVMLQGDDGTAMVFIIIFLAIVFAAGLSWKYILGAAALAPAVFWLLWTYYLQPVHKNRILSVIFPEKYSNADLLYQTSRSLIALGSGQLEGKGLFGGDYTYVPVCHSDFIFSYAGQTLGFIGCLAIVLLITLFCLRLLLSGMRSQDELGRYILVGIFSYFLTHSVLNIGMVTGITPVIGIPLPFFSAGGTAMLSSWLAVGLALSVYYHHQRFDTIFKN